METRLTSKNKEASKQVLVKENNDPEEGRVGEGGGGGELRTHLKPRAASPALPPAWERSLGPRLRGSREGRERERERRGGPLSIPGATSREGFAPRPRALLWARRGCVRPVPRPAEAVHTSAPGPELGWGGVGGDPAAPRRSGGGQGGGCCSAGAAALALRPAQPPTCGAGEERGGSLRGWVGCDPQRPGLGMPCPGGSLLPAAGSPAQPPAPRGRGCQPLPTEPGKFVNNSQPRW